MTPTFAQLGLPRPLVQALTERGLEQPFPIQESTIPAAMSGKDVCGMAPTGSGKTLAFGLPMLARVPRAGRRAPRALVLAPTRELAEQITQELAPLAKSVDRRVVAVYGGTSYRPAQAALNQGVDVLVATPGRLEDLMRQGSVDFAELSIVVVDEADRMADMGFLPAVRRILDSTPSHRQTLLFSATLDGDVAVLVRDYQRSPVRFQADRTERSAAEVMHHFWLVDHADRVQHTADIVAAVGRSIVFTRTRHGADRLARQLAKVGVEAVALHGGRSQGQRNRALRAFTTGRAEALVATDVAARGIHIDAVEAVVHFDPAADEKDFVHRSGRTGRAGATGVVVTLVTHEHRKNMTQLQRSLRIDRPMAPPRLDDLKAPATAAKSHLRPVPATRHARSVRPDGSRPQSTSTLFVGNLPWDTTADDLGRIFSRHGTVLDSKVPTRRGKSKGYGLVEMEHRSAPAAIDAMHSSMLGGRELVVRRARSG